MSLCRSNADGIKEFLSRFRICRHSYTAYNDRNIQALILNGQRFCPRQNINTCRNADKINISGRHITPETFIDNRHFMPCILNDSRNCQQPEMRSHPRL